MWVPPGWVGVVGEPRGRVCTTCPGKHSSSICPHGPRAGTVLEQISGSDPQHFSSCVLVSPELREDFTPWSHVHSNIYRQYYIVQTNNKMKPIHIKQMKHKQAYVPKLSFQYESKRISLHLISINTKDGDTDIFHFRRITPSSYLKAEWKL